MTSDDSTDRTPGVPETGANTGRRRFLGLAAGTSIAALAGCLGTDTDAEADVGTASDWCVEENDVEVPDIYERAQSIDGIERAPDDLSGREEAAYQCHPQGYQLCANCRYFIPSKHAGEVDRGAGACAIVEGIVRSQDWCALYQETEDLAEFPHPDPLGEEGQQKPPVRR